LLLKVFFQDEARFGRISEPQDCWSPKGFRPNVPAQIIREYTYAYGAVCPFDGDSCYLILPRMDAICMNVFLQELSMRYPDNYLLLVYDGAPCHSKTALNIPKNIEIITIPPYSPQLNPTENNWDDMREKFFQNNVFDSLEAVENQLVIACNFYEQNTQIIKSMTAWKWIVNS